MQKPNHRKFCAFTIVFFAKNTINNEQNTYSILSCQVSMPAKYTSSLKSKKPIKSKKSSLSNFKFHEWLKNSVLRTSVHFV